MRAVVTGATGFIGRPLCAALVARGVAVTALSRSVERAKERLGEKVVCLPWEQSQEEGWRQAVAEADVVFHLAGEAVGGKRWTPEVKARIRSSRVETTRTLVTALQQATSPPKTLISASAVGYYGEGGDSLLTEAAPAGQDFLGEVCSQWEAEALKAEQVGVRVVLMRLGIVLGDGSALQKMLYPLPIPISPWKLGLGGPLGNGRQWMPWIHLEDVVGMLLWAATQVSVQGAVNVTAPHLVTNADFSHALGRALHRPAILPIPKFALKILLGEFADSLLVSQKVVPTIAQQLGYAFRHSNLEEALQAILKKH